MNYIAQSKQRAKTRGILSKLRLKHCKYSGSNLLKANKIKHHDNIGFSG